MFLPLIRRAKWKMVAAAATATAAMVILHFNSLKSKFEFIKYFFIHFWWDRLFSLLHNIILNCIKCFVYKLNGNNRDFEMLQGGCNAGEKKRSHKVTLINYINIVMVVYFAFEWNKFQAATNHTILFAFCTHSFCLAHLDKEWSLSVWPNLISFIWIVCCLLKENIKQGRWGH